MRVAAIDCGTNSIRLLVAEAADDVDRPGTDGCAPHLTDVLRRMEVVRLGYGVDATGVIAPESMARTLAMTREYALQCDELEVEAVRFVTTSASRDARNADEFVTGVRQAFGGRDVAPEVLSGAEEARLSFSGATGDVTSTGAAAPYLVVDLGGGSTEFVRGAGGAEHSAVEASVSVDMGCVRMTERHLHGDPPTPWQIATARRDVETHLDRVDIEIGLAGIGTLVGLAGTVTTVTAYALGLPRYDSAAIHLSSVEVGRTLTACAELLAMPCADRARLPFMHPGRVDVIGAGALVWGCVVERVTAASGIQAVLTSEHDILDGIALSLVA